MTNNRKYFLRACPEALKGSILAYGLVIMAAVSIVLTSIIGFVVSQTKYSLRVHSREEALQVAEAGINYYRWYLAHKVDGKTAQQVKDYWETGSPIGVGTAYEAGYADPSGGAVGRYSLLVTPPESGSSVVTVRSTGWTNKYSDDKRTIEARLRRPSWSEYIVLSDAPVRFGEGTEIYGRIHSNYGIRFDGLAHSLVTSGVSSYDDPDHNDHDLEFGVHTHKNPVDPLPPAAMPDRPDVFEGGRQTGVATTDFSGILGDLSTMKSVAEAGTKGSLYFNNAHQGRHIILKTDDTFSIRTVQSFSSSTNDIINYSGDWQTYPLPDDGIIFVEGHVWLEGKIDSRRVTIVAANLSSAALKSVFIAKDVSYTNTGCSDMLGIIGQDDVEIPRSSEDILEIDGALLAQTGRVGRDHYNGTGSVRDTITVYGAIVSKQRYGFAYTDGTGYQTRNLYFDNNLLYCPPPYFPVGTEYEMDLWEEK